MHKHKVGENIIEEKKEKRTEIAQFYFLDTSRYLADFANDTSDTVKLWVLNRQLFRSLFIVFSPKESVSNTNLITDGPLNVIASVVGPQTTRKWQLCHIFRSHLTILNKINGWHTV